MLVAALLFAAVPAGPGACLRALAPVAAGAIAVRDDFASAPCGGEAGRALRYEPHAGTLSAMRDIAEGETILAPPSSLLPDVRPGDPLFLVARVGTAMVERGVVAAQPGRRGQPIFVRTPDGGLVAARLREDER